MILDLILFLIMFSGLIYSFSTASHLLQGLKLFASVLVRKYE